MSEVVFKEVSFTYADTEKSVLRDCSFTAGKGAFVLLMGPSGSGKSTLLRLMKPALRPKGLLEGSILIDGDPLVEETGDVGFVMQDPDSQLCASTVLNELCFSAECLGLASDEIGLRLAETADFFGLEGILHEKTADLSGGQKQLVSLASAMIAGPRLLLLDEPTSQLDPIAAVEFIHLLRRINRELGTTVILSEHRLEEVFPLCDQVLYLKAEGPAFGTPSEIAARMAEQRDPYAVCLPTAAALSAALGKKPVLTVKDARVLLQKVFPDGGAVSCAQPEQGHGKPALKLENGWFRYGRDGRDVLRGTDLTVEEGCITCILGGNGAGKSTLAAVLAGTRRLYRGKAEHFGRTVLLPQDPKTLFLKASVLENLLLCGEEKAVRCTALELGISEKLSVHPFDLSGGEQQKLGLCMALLKKPDILILDEPTKGLDGVFKKQLGETLKMLARNGMTIVVISHDVEFCAVCADRCLMLFDGDIACDRPARAFFSGNRFYTTAAARIAAGLVAGAVTKDDILSVRGNRHE